MIVLLKNLSESRVTLAVGLLAVADAGRRTFLSNFLDPTIRPILSPIKPQQATLWRRPFLPPGMNRAPVSSNRPEFRTVEYNW